MLLGHLCAFANFTHYLLQIYKKHILTLRPCLHLLGIDAAAIDAAGINLAGLVKTH